MDLSRASVKTRTIEHVARVRGRGKVQMDFATEGLANRQQMATKPVKRKKESVQEDL